MCRIFVVLSLSYLLESPRKLSKMLMSGPHLAKIDLIDLGCGLGPSSLGDFPVQLRLKVSVLETQTESTQFEHATMFS